MESQQNRYFVDGFMIRHFGIYPAGFDKDNLFDEQKLFLMYLVGGIPDMESWSTNVEYKIQLSYIEHMTTDDIELSEADIDVCNIKGQDVNELRTERLSNEKQTRLKALRLKFGIREEVVEIEQPKLKPKEKDRKTMWQMLQGEGLVK